MILFSTFSVLQTLIESGEFNPEKTILFNLSSFREGLPDLGILPTNEVMATMFSQDQNTKVLDDNLFNYIYYNDEIFYNFFSKIMYPFYSGLDILIAVSVEEPFSSLTESIIKIIQQRYGYNCAFINYPEDLMYLQDSKDATMNLLGVYNFDIDKQRYITVSSNKGMKVPVTDKDELNDPLLVY